MKIAFDHQIFAIQAYGGISRYFVKLAQELQMLRQEVCVVAPWHRNNHLTELPSELVLGTKWKRFPPRSARMALWLNSVFAARAIRQEHPDVLHETYYFGSSRPRRDVKTVITVYDMIHEKFPTAFRANDPTSKAKLNAVRRADHVICISENTKHDLCEFTDIPDSKISVIHLGFEKISEDSNAVTQASRPFLLYVGHRDHYKNFDSTLQALARHPRITETFDLVAFGGNEFSREELRRIDALKLREGAVRNVQGDDDLLGLLYRTATAFVYPSLYEGFGLPPLEAMAHDCPVAASSSSSIPEVVGDAGLMFDPTDIDAQGHALEQILFDTGLRENLIRAGRKRLLQFSWKRCAEQTLQVYQKLHAPI